MKLNILHLADLHCNGDDEFYLSKISNALCGDLESLSASGAKPDIVCVTGDLVDRAQAGAAAYNLVESLFLAPIRQCLGISKDSFFFVPGNHDVDRTQVSQPYELGLEQSITDQSALYKFYRTIQSSGPDLEMVSRKLTSYFAFAHSYKNANLKHRSFFYDVYEVKHGTITLGIVSLNSAWRSSQFGEDAGRLILGEHIVTEAAAKVAHCDLRLCLCHHPFEMLTEWDAKPVRQMVVKHFHALLNGHVHDSDAAATKQLFGNLFVSTVGCLKVDEPFSSYTTIQMDLDKDSITCLFRKWYNDRGQFDQETAKASNGRIEFSGIRTVPESVRTALQIAVVRGQLQAQGEAADVLSPIDGIEDVELDEVFIEPLLTDKSAFDRNTDERKTLCLNDLLKSDSNLFLAGRPEFGKTTILRYTNEYILRNDKHFESKIPVLINFNDLPKINVKHTLRAIAKVLCRTEEETESFAGQGQLIILIDDFNDRQDAGHEKRVATMRDFFRAYPKCRYIFTATDFLAQPLQFELLTLASDFRAQIAYIESLNTSRIRQLLLKWKAKQDFDVDAMLHQILYYFQHCQIPVTPLAVILFLGVLFRKKKERTIRNEAFLIENYLETILEKLDPSEKDTDTDFRDKEDFLAAVALEMVQSGKRSLDATDFEKLQIGHFEKRDEDLPHRSFFEAFFAKGILVRDEGYISFSRRFWFHFFLAKALEWSKDVEKQFLLRDDVLRFSKALSYRAGLSRKEVDLLKLGGRASDERDATVH